MLIALWILNALLALAFLGAGVSKIARTRQAIVASGMHWAADFTDASVKLIGVVEVIGAIGLILPLIAGVATVLAPLAAVGLALSMLVAIAVHVRRKEAPTPAVALTVLSAISAVIGFSVLV